MKQPVSIIGMGLSPKDLTQEHLGLIRHADILVGGKRLLDFFTDSPAKKKEITRDIKGIIEYIKRRMQKNKIVVLASGDPLFFGIGSVLINSLGRENVLIYPNISTVAAAFSRLKLPWHDAHIISVHGRNKTRALLPIRVKKDKIAVFTDPENNPAWLANYLLEKGITDYDMCVLEQLGTSSERVDWYIPSEAAGIRFSEPNLVILKLRESGFEKITKIYSGMPEYLFDHPKGLITKAEIRAITLSKLRLMPDHILWDLGAGSGSISIEASIFIKLGRIFAIEKNPERIIHIQNNRKRFNVKNLEIIQSVLPDGLDTLPVPDRIFIGGGGKDLEKIIRSSSGYLKQDGVMVIHTILISNIEVAMSTLKSQGFITDIVQAQISRGQEMPWGKRLDAENPVWIITGEKRKS
jgi:precorrin-6B C5,15-methyltransferase / cobalt-precorrin-6B C5,C15-methyltransferase